MQFYLLLSLFNVFSVLASSVIEATDKDFEKIISKPNTYSFVKFYASWCGHCKRMAPTWDELADLYAKNDNVQIVKIDCDINKKTGNKYKIEGFPTLKMFHPGDSEPRDYQGGRDLESFQSFVSYATGIKVAKQPVEDNVVHMSDADYKSLLKGKHGLFSITASWCGHCKKLKPEWTKLANVFKNDESVVIGDVLTTDVESDAIQEKFEVRGFPTILYVSPEDSEVDSPEPYTGGRTLQDFVDFINEKTSIGRKTDGTLTETAGRLPKIDEKIEELPKEPTSLESSVINELIADLDEFKSDLEYSVKYYKKLLTKLKNKEVKFFEKEFKRLSNMLNKSATSVNGKIRDNLVKRINILKVFVPFSTIKRDEL